MTPGFKAFKDRFTLLLGANLTGDCKLKPVLVYHAENLCTFNSQSYQTSSRHTVVDIQMSVMS